MPTSSTKAANTTLRRASKRVSSAFKSAFGPYSQTDDHTQGTLDTMRGWLEDDNVNVEDLLYGIIGEGVYREIFPPVPYSVEGSAALFDHYRNDIGKNTINSLMYTLNPTHNHNVAGEPSPVRLELWRRVSEARNRQKSLLQTAGASMMYGMASPGSTCPPQTVFDRLDTATDTKVNRQIARNMSRLVSLTLEEQDVWQNEEKAQDESGPERGRVLDRAFSTQMRL